jgi:predicted nuclease of predicted toxin-antitoxin system
MSYRILADENVERATVNYLRKLDHDIEWLGDISELGLGADDKLIAAYAHKQDRLILTQDDDFFTEPEITLEYISESWL